MPPWPCALPPGLKWPPVLIPSPELQSPFSWTWKPCSAFGLRPVILALTATAAPRCVNVTVPAVELPFVGSSVAVALGPAALPPPPDIPAQPAAIALAIARPRILFMRPPRYWLGGAMLLGLL